MEFITKEDLQRIFNDYRNLPHQNEAIDYLHTAMFEQNHRTLVNKGAKWLVAYRNEP